MQSRKLFICVVEIENMHRVYCGRSLSLAAIRLEPGTCYGWGDNHHEALTAGMDEALAFRKNGSK